jgi:hypothetical protein
MPKYQRYPNEAPDAARRRISKNVAMDKGNPAAQPGLEEKPRLRGKRSKGYNITKNLGKIPGIGY